MWILIAIASVIGFIAYVAFGFIISATLCKRSSASWRWWSSNLGEFIMSMSVPGLLILAVFWPIQVLIGLVLTAPSAIMNAFKRMRMLWSKPAPTTVQTHWKDFEVSSMYPTVSRDSYKHRIIEKHNRPSSKE